MLGATFSLISADPPGLGDLVSKIDAEVRPAVEGEPDSLGTSLFLQGPSGRMVFQSVWGTKEGMLAHAPAVTAAETAALGDLTTRPEVDRFELPVFELERRLGPGASVELSWMDTGRSEVPDAVELYGDAVVAVLAEAAGFCGAALLIDYSTGRSVAETFWRDDDARTAHRGLAAAIRADLVTTAGWHLQAVEDYSLAFSTARKP